MANLSETAVLIATPVLAVPLTGFQAAIGVGAKRIYGTVADGSPSPLARTVFALNRSTRALLDVALSDAGDGTFELRVPDVSCVVVCLPDGDGTNAQIYDDIAPVDPV